MAVVSELIPSATILLVTRQRRSSLQEGALDNPSDFTRSSSMPDVLDAASVLSDVGGFSRSGHYFSRSNSWNASRQVVSERQRLLSSGGADAADRVAHSTSQRLPGPARGPGLRLHEESYFAPSSHGTPPSSSGQPDEYGGHRLVQPSYGTSPAFPARVDLLAGPDYHSEGHHHGLG